ncbi:hypothetical protein SLEP1_g42374 [Rubroshorea leprosula]|uniref:Transposon Ty3-I Gag-Pol polyprotein n=1 Tax=Rubroshorea leprosula TaxID=152421 RepID=A0AAV5LA93_9ROSI|nr:hypothetical protein SLEP1_g42374 [Rubroshorea leprosula]
MVNTRSFRARNQAQPLGQGRSQSPNNLPPYLPPPIPDLFPPIDQPEGGDENQPHNSTHNSASTANQDVVTAQLAAMEGESLKNYMSRFNDAVLEVSSFNEAVGIAAVIQGLQHERFRDSLIKHPAATFNEVNDRSLKFITVEEYALSQKPILPKNQNLDWRDEGSAPDIMYFHCFESLKLDPALLQRYDGPIYGFNNQPVQVEGVLTLNVAFGSGRTYVTPSIRFLVVKMSSSFNAVIGRPTLTEIQAVISQSHLWMKFPTPIGIATLQADMLGIPTSVIKEEVEKLLQTGFVRRVDYCEWVANPVLVKKANGKWRMCIDYTNLNQACPKDYYPMPSIDKLVEAASGNERLSLLDAYFGYHQVPMALEDEEKSSFYVVMKFIAMS